MTRWKALKLICLLWNDFENITISYWNGEYKPGWSTQYVLKQKEEEK